MLFPVPSVPAVRFVPLAALLLLVAVAGCVQQTPYQAATPSRPGFSDTRIEENRFQIRVTGSSVTPRALLSQQLLYRAAELTLYSGNQWFRVVGRAGDPVLGAGPERVRRAGRHRYRHPYRYRHRYPYRPRRAGVRIGFGFGFPFYYGYPDPYYYGRPARRRANEVVAEILVFPGEKPPDDPDAYDAVEVLERLGPVLRPEIQ